MKKKTEKKNNRQRMIWTTKIDKELDKKTKIHDCQFDHQKMGSKCPKPATIIWSRKSMCLYP